MRADIAFTRERAEITNASLSLGGSRVEGRATIEKFKPITLSYDAASPSLALADVKPPQPSVKKPEHLDGLSAKGSLVVDPVSKLPSGSGTATSSSGSVANVDYRDLSASYTIDGKTTRFSGLKANALDGVVTGSGMFTAAETGSSFDIQLAADKVDITELLIALPGTVQKSLRGRATHGPRSRRERQGMARYPEDAEGKRVSPSSSTARSSTSTSPARSSTSSANTSARRISSPTRSRRSTPRSFEQKNTSFNNLKSDFVVENGRLLARNLQLKHADYGILAKGSIGFDRTLDVAATFVVAKKLVDDIARSYPAAGYLRNARGEIELPLVLGGALPNVRCSPTRSTSRI